VTTEARPLRKALLSDVKRMLPIWALVFGAAAGTLLVLRETGRRYIERGLYASGDTCTVAGIRAAAGEAAYVKLKEEAEAKLKLATSKDPSEVRNGALGIFKDDARLDQVAENLREAARLCPGYEHLYYDLSEVALWQGEAGLSHFYLGKFHRSRNERDAARMEFTLASEKLPDDPLPHIALADVLLDEGDTAAAQGVMDHREKEAQESIDGMGVLARLAVIRGDNDAARELVLKGLRQEPSSQKLAGILQGITDAMPDPVEAAKIYAELAALPGSHSAGMHHLSGLYFARAEAWSDAEPQFGRAAALAQNNVVVLFDHAVSLWHLKRYDAARDVYNRAVAVDVEQAVTLKNRSAIDPSQRP